MNRNEPAVSSNLLVRSRLPFPPSTAGDRSKLVAGTKDELFKVPPKCAEARESNAPMTMPEPSNVSGLEAWRRLVHSVGSRHPTS